MNENELEELLHSLNDNDWFIIPMKEIHTTNDSETLQNCCKHRNT